MKHVACKHLSLTDYWSRNPIAQPEPTENYDEEYVIICITPLLEFINIYGSITDERKSTTRTGQTAFLPSKQPIISETRATLQTSDNERNNCSSLLPAKCYVRILSTNSYHPIYHYENKRLGIKTAENIEREDPSEKTLALTNR